MNLKNTTVTKIGMREFMRNTKIIKSKVAQGQVFEVLDHAEPVFRIVPINDRPLKKYKMEDLALLGFASKETDLSEQVDHYVYGTPKTNNHI